MRSVINVTQVSVAQHREQRAAKLTSRATSSGAATKRAAVSHVWVREAHDVEHGAALHVRHHHPQVLLVHEGAVERQQVGVVQLAHRLQQGQGAGEEGSCEFSRPADALGRHRCP